MGDTLTLTEAKEKLLEQDQILKKILVAATITGVTIKQITEERWLCIMDGSLQVMGFDPRLTLKPGLTVLIYKSQQTTSIVEVLKEKIHEGIVCKVEEVIGEKAVVTINNDKRKVFVPSDIKVKAGDDVFVYGENLVTSVYKAGKSNHSVASTGISWEDIGGLSAEKALMQEIIEKPIEHKELYLSYNQKPPKGALLFGPPGNGKTLLGKALATSISKHYKTNVNSFFYIKGPELLSKFVGVAEESIRNLFATARSFYKEHGFPAIIFIDEAEAILGRRGSGKSSDVEKTIVPQFLTEMDGIEESNVIVILASNRPDMIDSAILRDGRIDKKIRINNPDRETAQAIISINLKKTKLADPEEKVKSAFLDELYSEKYPLYEVISDEGKKLMFYLRDLTSGATLANIVTATISNALRRDINAAAKKASGIKCEDATEAVVELYKQHKGYKHREQLEDFAEANGIKIKQVSKYE